MRISLMPTLIVWLSLGDLSASAGLKKVSLKGYNPGICNETNHGNLIMVKDRENDDKLLVCAEEKNVYLWKTTDGSSPTGEFFNPAYDCSDVLNKIADAKDGFYWIKLPGNVPNRLWCDMNTDGGGWTLIGRTTNAVMWTVPSNNKTVEPFGKPHWSSSLGDASILDFRVQVATQEDFSATKAHWSFRLQKERPLKNLLMINEGGCGKLSPGIGNISYVKDLQNDEIVTTKFRCSQFTSHHSKFDGFGWDMLNTCFKRPCSPGFAFHKHYPVQIDSSGSFSYSANGNTTSGITHESTSFVGCDSRKCCGCFGPVGGKKNYCGTECTAKNGGTIVKHVYTWFWVRSSLPKRVWNKCMEYKETVAPGKKVWYKLYHGNNVPVMGRCDQKEALLNDGIVVVPDSVAARNVPHVPGLLEYRKDTKKLYVRSNETWNVIGEEKEVLRKAAEQVKTKLDQVEARVLSKAAKQVEPKLEQVKTKVTLQQYLNNANFDQLKKSLFELKSQLASVNRTVSGLTWVEEKNCADLYKSGARRDGVYTVNPDGLRSFQVRCDMQTDGGGWTIFQRRQDSSVDFYRGWQDYKTGFGNLNGNFWLGLEKIHRLTRSGQNVLRVDLTDWTNDSAYAKYGSFSVASESNAYKMNCGKYSGNAGDSLAVHNGMKFTTYDRDNDVAASGNCALSYRGAWWHESCHASNLNGLYLKAGARSGKGMDWYYWKNDHRSMKKTEMKIRPAQF